MTTMAHSEDALRDVGDCQHVIHGFARQTDHEVELDGAPASIEGQLGAPRDLLVAHALVDGVAKPLRSGLRGKSEATAASARHDCVHQLDCEGVDTRARQRQEDVGPESVQFGDDLTHMGVIGRGETRQPYLLVAGRPQNCLGRRHRDVRRAFPQWPRLHPRLAEAAASSTATHDLDLGPVEDDAHVGHELANAMNDRFEVGSDTAGYHGRSGGIQTVQASEAAISLIARAI